MKTFFIAILFIFTSLSFSNCSSISLVKPTLTPTIRPTPKLVDITFVSFFDYNGNGNQDLGEPFLKEINIKTYNYDCITDSNGKCEFLNIPTGNYTTYIQAPDNFKYITPSLEEDIEISKGLNLFVDNSKTVFVPLVEGPYRSPFHNLDKITVRQWKDIDIRTCWGIFPDRNCDYREDWLGNKNTYDGHDGTDFEIEDETLIYAMRAGEVVEIEPVNENEGYSILILDDLPFEETGKSYQAFVHISSVDVEIGQKVNPNTVLGKGGSKNIGGKIHINQYIHVGNEHPANPLFQINPYVPCPFQQHLWTSFNSLGSKIFQHDELTGILSIIFP